MGQPKSCVALRTFAGIDPTQQKIFSEEALRLGVANEVLAPDELMPRAWVLARQLATLPTLPTLPTLTLRYMRVATAQRLKELVVREVGHELALQGLSGAALGNPDPNPRPQDVRG